MRLAIILLTLILTGCAAISPERTTKMTDKQLCNAYGDARDNWSIKKNLPNLKSEIMKRGLVKESEWQLIDDKQVRIGMSVCALRASWGPAKENSTTSRYGSHIQHVYRLSWCHRCNVQYVYTENGVVTAIQD
jgi:hypothetical protein